MKFYKQQSSGRLQKEMNKLKKSENTVKNRWDCVEIFTCACEHIYIYIYIFKKINKSDKTNKNACFMLFIFYCSRYFRPSVIVRKNIFHSGNGYATQTIYIYIYIYGWGLKSVEKWVNWNLKFSTYFFTFWRIYQIYHFSIYIYKQKERKKERKKERLYLYLISAAFSVFSVDYITMSLNIFFSNHSHTHDVFNCNK